MLWRTWQTFSTEKNMLCGCKGASVLWGWSHGGRTHHARPNWLHAVWDPMRFALRIDNREVPQTHAQNVSVAPLTPMIKFTSWVYIKFAAPHSSLTQDLHFQVKLKPSFASGKMSPSKKLWWNFCTATIWGEFALFVGEEENLSLEKCTFLWSKAQPDAHVYGHAVFTETPHYLIPDIVQFGSSHDESKKLSPSKMTQTMVGLRSLFSFIDVILVHNTMQICVRCKDTVEGTKSAFGHRYIKISNVFITRTLTKRLNKKPALYQRPVPVSLNDDLMSKACMKRRTSEDSACMSFTFCNHCILLGSRTLQNLEVLSIHNRHFRRHSWRGLSVIWWDRRQKRCTHLLRKEMDTALRIRNKTRHVHEEKRIWLQNPFFLQITIWNERACEQITHAESELKDWGMRGKHWRRGTLHRCKLQEIHKRNTWKFTRMCQNITVHLQRTKRTHAESVHSTNDIS